MKISMSMAHGRRMGLSLADTAHIMKEIGFDGIDLDMSFDYDDRPARWEEAALAEAKAAHDAGLAVSQVHMPYYPGHIDAPGIGDYADFEALLLPDYIRSVEICADIGCDVAVMHPFFTMDSYKGSVEGNKRMLEKLMPAMEKGGVRVALENVYASRNGQYLPTAMSNEKGILDVIDGMGTRMVGACLDTGHARIFREDVIRMAKAYSERLIALHVNSNGGGDDHVLPGSMSAWCELIDYTAFAKTLSQIGYRGSFNLEVGGSGMPSFVAKPYYAYAFAVARAFSEPTEC